MQELFRVIVCSDLPNEEQLWNTVVVPFGMHSIMVVANIPEITELSLNFPALAGIVDG
jgi:ABC-type phosphate transport system substrate-binding protein